MDKLKMQSVDMTQRNIEKIGALFPNVITEMKDENGKLKKGINFELLKQELSSDIVEGDECYDFTWVGKKASIVEGNTPIRKTLRPCIEESKDWENTQNLYIEGDNLDVLKLLQESYLNSIKMIYIDPPYNTGSDFIYKDNFKVNKDEYDEQIGIYDEDENRLFKNTETNGRFHSDWCSMIYPRLKLAHNLLCEDGVIFISIDDNEKENLNKICNEVFGEDNSIAFIVHKNNSNKNQTNLIGVSTEYVYIYAKNKRSLADYRWRIPKKGAGDIVKLFNDRISKGVDLDDILVEVKEMYKRAKYAHLSRWNKIDEKGIFKDENISREGGPKNYTIINPSNGKECVVPPRGWGKSYEELLDLQKKGLIYYGNENTPPAYKYYLAEDTISVPDNFWYFDNSIDTRFIKSIFSSNIFENPKPVDMIKQMLTMHVKDNDIVLDFFSGSATTAHAVMQLNSEDGEKRKFIMVQLPELIDEKSKAYKVGYKNICEIGKERIRRAGEKIKEENKDKEGIDSIDIGFRVLKVDSINMKDVYYSANELNQEMIAGLESNIKEDRTDLDLLYGVLLDWGLPLSLRHKIEEIEGVPVHVVDEGSLVACFADKISESIVREIAKLQPLRVVFKDSSFVNSSDKVNVEEIFKIQAPNTTVKVI